MYYGPTVSSQMKHSDGVIRFFNSIHVISRVIPPPSLQSSKGDSLARRRILEELSTTENPLWLETKLRPYEEQELTMNVFGDQEQQIIEPAPVSTIFTWIGYYNKPIVVHCWT